MTIIDTKNKFPGIIGLLAFNPSTAVHINGLAEQLLRTPSDTLSRGERELLFTAASYANGCHFCAGVHSECAKQQLDDPDVVEALRLGGPCALMEEYPKLHELAHLAIEVARLQGQVLRDRMTLIVDLAKSAGATDQDIHDTVLIAGLAAMCNRYVDGLVTEAPESPGFYVEAAQMLINRGYEKVIG